MPQSTQALTKAGMPANYQDTTQIFYYKTKRPSPNSVLHEDERCVVLLQDKYPETNCIEKRLSEVVLKNTTCRSCESYDTWVFKNKAELVEKWELYFKIKKIDYQQENVLIYLLIKDLGCIKTVLSKHLNGPTLKAEWSNEATDFIRTSQKQLNECCLELASTLLSYLKSAEKQTQLKKKAMDSCLYRGNSTTKNQTEMLAVIRASAWVAKNDWVKDYTLNWLEMDQFKLEALESFKLALDGDWYLILAPKIVIEDFQQTANKYGKDAIIEALEYKGKKDPATLETLSSLWSSTGLLSQLAPLEETVAAL